MASPLFVSAHHHNQVADWTSVLRPTQLEHRGGYVGIPQLRLPSQVRIEHTNTDKESARGGIHSVTTSSLAGSDGFEPCSLETKRSPTGRGVGQGEGKESLTRPHPRAGSRRTLYHTSFRGTRSHKLVCVRHLPPPNQTNPQQPASPPFPRTARVVLRPRLRRHTRAGRRGKAAQQPPRRHRHSIPPLTRCRSRPPPTSRRSTGRLTR